MPFLGFFFILNLFLAEDNSLSFWDVWLCESPGFVPRYSSCSEVSRSYYKESGLNFRSLCVTEKSLFGKKSYSTGILFFLRFVDDFLVFGCFWPANNSFLSFQARISINLSRFLGSDVFAEKSVMPSRIL